MFRKGQQGERDIYKKERHEDENVIIIKGDWGHHKRDEIWEKSGWAGEGKEAMRLEMNRPRAVEEILVFCSLQFSTEKTFFLIKKYPGDSFWSLRIR